MDKGKTIIIININTKRVRDTKKYEDFVDEIALHNKKIGYHLGKIDKHLGFIDDAITWLDWDFDENWL